MNGSSHVHRALRHGLGIALASAWGAALAQPSYKLLEVPPAADPHNTTVHTFANAINRAGMMASGLFQELGGGAAFRCDKFSCVFIPPLSSSCHHCSTSAEAINDAGFVVGRSPYLNFGRGYLFDGAATLNLGAFREGPCDGCDLGSLAHGINNLGQVVGAGETDAGPYRAFVWQDGVMQKLDTLGGERSEAWAINDNSEVVGESTLLNGQTHAFMHRRGRMRDLGTLGGTWSAAYAINQARQVVGCSKTPGDAQTVAFVYQSGVMTALPTLGGSQACAYGINTRGWAVGSALTAGDAQTHGFIYDGNSVIDLNDTLSAADRTTWVVIAANGINKKGQIAAVGANLVYGTTRALLLTPRGSNLVSAPAGL